jgi:hypothetical protein
MNRTNSETGRGEEYGNAKTWTLADLVPVLEALKGLRYGSVELIIQDSRLVQIERREKFRSLKA